MALWAAKYDEDAKSVMNGINGLWRVFNGAVFSTRSS